MSFKEAIKTVLKQNLRELDDEDPSLDEPSAAQRAEDLMTILAHSLVPLDYVAELAHVQATDLKVWTDYDLIPSIKLDDKVFISGEKVIHMLEDENHSLRLSDPSALPLTPDLAMKRLIKAEKA